MRSDDMAAAELMSAHRLTPESRDRLHRIEPRSFAWILAAFAAYYVLAYLGTADLPAGDGSTTGWWAWFDQGEYLKSATALAHGDFHGNLHNYPPLYAAMAALAIKLLPAHPFFPIDIVAFVTFVGVLLWIAGRIYGLSVALIAVIAILCIAPSVTIHQWVTPWTTTMSGLLISLQLAVAWHFQAKEQAWQTRTRSDWLLVALFFVSYSGLAATRPLDFVAFLPLAVVVFLRLEIGAWSGPKVDQRKAACLRMLGFCLAICAVCAALLTAFNLRAYGHVTSDYIWRSGGGYSFATVPQKVYSIFLHSGSIYADQGTALFETLPIFAPIFAVALVSLFTARPFMKGIILLGLLQILLYLPFPDLMPTALFRFAEIHYFKWILMWFPVIALGELVSWFRMPLSFRSRLMRALAIGAILLVFTRLALVPVTEVQVEGRRDEKAGMLDIGPTVAENVSYIDIPKLAGDRQSLYFNANPLTLNGIPLTMVRDYRFIPYRDGARLVFLRPQSVRDIHIAFDAGNKLGADDTKLALIGMKLGFGGVERPDPDQAASSRW